MGERRFLIIYVAAIPPVYPLIAWRGETKAAIVLDDPAEPQLPYGYDPEFIGDDQVRSIVAAIEVTDLPEDLTIVMGDSEVRFNQAGLMVVEDID